MSPGAILAYLKAQPFRPFQIRMNSGRTFDIRHPEMVRITQYEVVIFTSVSDNTEVFDRWVSIGHPLIESITHLDAPVA